MRSLVFGLIVGVGVCSYGFYGGDDDGNDGDDKRAKHVRGED